MIAALGRRALIQRLAGMAAASAVISPKDVLAAAGGVSVPLDAPRNSYGGGEVGCDPAILDVWRIVEEMRDRHYDQFIDNQRGLHHSIASKRSWSPAFKAHAHAQMQAEMRAAAALLQRDERVARRVAKMLGFA